MIRNITDIYSCCIFYCHLSECISGLINGPGLIRVTPVALIRRERMLFSIYITVEPRFMTNSLIYHLALQNAHSFFPLTIFFSKRAYFYLFIWFIKFFFQNSAGGSCKNVDFN